MRSWHVWTVPPGELQTAMRHVDGEDEADAILNMDDYPEKIEPCDGSGFYCMSRGQSDITRWAKQSRKLEKAAE
jgi:hypothetical protein